MTEDLAIARELAELGMPLFLAYPDASKPNGYALPPGWQRTPADPSVVDHWQPGMALCAVTGHVLDLIDLDPRSGGVLPVTGLTPMAVASTPSGGQHLFVLPLGVASRDGVWPGVDIKSGTPDGSGRGFAFIAPTVRASKVDGLPRPYVWSQDHRPDKTRINGALLQRGQHPRPLAAEVIRRRIAELRVERAPSDLPRRIPQSVARDEWQRAVDKLATDLRHWAANGWGGEAHAGLLAATTHLARLAPDSAAEAFEACFAWAGLVPDEADLAKLDTALAAAVPDVVVPDADMPPQELFWAGGIAPMAEPDPPAGDASGPPAAGPEYTRAGGFQFLSEAELDRIPVPDALIDGLLWSDSVARVFGPSTVGKTWVGLDIGAHVANGMPWQGREVKQAPVLYVAAEGAPTIGPRLRAWRSFHGRQSQIKTWPEAVPIGGPTWAEFVTACIGSNLGLIVMDTQAAMTVGSKEDSNDDASRIKAHLEALARATRACVLLIHHNGWAEDGRARGASGMYAALDTELQLIEGQGERAVSLIQRKQRYAERGAPTRLRLQPHDGQLVVAPANVDGSSADAFLAADMDARARALLEKILAYEASGGALPPKLGVRDVKRVIREEMFETVETTVAEAAVRMLKRTKGIAV